MPEPPSCSMIIKAKNDPDTAEVFHYPVPLHGVNKPEQIFIHLSLRSVSSVPGNFILSQISNLCTLNYL